MDIRRIGWVSLLLVSAPVVAEDSVPHFAHPGDPAGPQMGEDAAAFRLRAFNEEAAIKMVSGPEIALNDFVGISPEHPAQAVVLQFFSITDKRSRRDIPELQKLFKRYRDDGLVVLAINIDSDASDEVYAMIEEERLGFPVLKDRFGIVARRYGLRHLPCVYVIDREGKVASVREGYSDDIADILESEVKELLKK